MHLEILDETRIRILEKLNHLDFIRNFCLGGGTAISLQLGLRNSYDFDFFSYSHFDIDKLKVILSMTFKEVKVIDEFEPKSTLSIIIDGVNLSFFEYSHKNIQNEIQFKEFNNIKMFSLIDLMLMKCVAIAQRGTKKDFFDFYFLIKELKINEIDLINLLDQKYSNPDLKIAFSYSLTYFDEAENEILPKAYCTYSWEDIKNFLKDYQKKISKIIFKL